jgi:hypothetical protein
MRYLDVVSLNDVSRTWAAYKRWVTTTATALRRTLGNPRFAPTVPPFCTFYLMHDSVPMACLGGMVPNHISQFSTSFLASGRYAVLSVLYLLCVGHSRKRNFQSNRMLTYALLKVHMVATCTDGSAQPVVAKCTDRFYPVCCRQEYRQVLPSLL